MLHALRQVERDTCDAIIVARTEWERAEMLHVRLTHVPGERAEGIATMILDNIMGYWVTNYPFGPGRLCCSGGENSTWQWSRPSNQFLPSNSSQFLEGDWELRWAAPLECQAERVLTVLRAANQAAYTDV